jgi:hypothetical protein
MSRFVRIVLLVGVSLIVAPPATSVASTGLGADLATLWTKVLETPSAQNSFGTGGQAYACWDLGNGTVAPFAPTGVKSCTVTPGTAIFVAANSVECSTFEVSARNQIELYEVCGPRRERPISPAPLSRAPMSSGTRGPILATARLPAKR